MNGAIISALYMTTIATQPSEDNKEENDMKKLKLYKVGFTPNPCDTPAISRSVYILAYSEDQARKFLRDWMVNVKKCIYLYEGCQYIKTNSKEWWKAMGNRSVEDRWEAQQKIIYGRK